MLLISVRGPAVRFTEIDLFGVYIAPMSVMIVAAGSNNRVALERRSL